jgi:hypothetical protein
LCAWCCHCLWIVHTWLLLRFFLMLILYLSLNWDNCSNFISFGGKMWLYWFCRCFTPTNDLLIAEKAMLDDKWQLDSILKQKTLGAIQTKLGKIWSSGFRGDLWNSLWCKTNSWWLTSSRWPLVRCAKKCLKYKQIWPTINCICLTVC